MSIDGVFFDLYGTLILNDSSLAARNNWKNCFSSIIENYGIDLTNQKFDLIANIFWSEVITNCPEMTPFENRINSFFERFNTHLDRREISSLASTMCRAWQKELPLDPSAVQLLNSLWNHKKMGIVSNFDHPPHIYETLNLLGISKYFDVIVISGDVGVKKPDPKIFETALEKIGLKSTNVIHIGDSIVDYEAATSANIKSVIIRRKGQQEVEISDRIKEKYAESDRYLEEIAEKGQINIIDNLLSLEQLIV